MANVKLICTSALLLALTACNTILFTEGRQLKAKGEVEHTPILDHIHAYDGVASQTNHGSILYHSVAGNKQTPRTRTFHRSLGYENPMAVDENDFDSYPDNMGNVQTSKKADDTGVSHAMAGNADDFRPTTPGHSPGVGHSMHNTNAEQNPLNLQSAQGCIATCP